MKNKKDNRTIIDYENVDLKVCLDLEPKSNQIEK
jgi:hypothetical protein